MRVAKKQSLLSLLREATVASLSERSNPLSSRIPKLPYFQCDHFSSLSNRMNADPVYYMWNFTDFNDGSLS